jgi:molybdopterin molybdotransferase
MVTYSEALEIILNNIQPSGVEEKSVVDAEGQVLAEDVYAEYDFPLTDIASPDGYAVIAKDIEKAAKNNPVILHIIETVRAGVLSQKTVTPGTAIRIMTGSVIPQGADCVVKFEDTDEPENKNGPNPNNPALVKIYVSQEPGKYIQKAGVSLKKGALLVKRGVVIGPAQLIPLLTSGTNRVKVVRRPRVAIISTGDELIKIGDPLAPGQAVNSNEAVLRSLVSHAGGIPQVLGIARDTEKSITAKLQKALAADMILTSGGVSRGDYDLVRTVLGKMGKVLFSHIKNGPAFVFAVVEKPADGDSRTTIPVFGIGGPPLGTLIEFERLIRYGLLKMRGVQEITHPSIEAICDESIAGIKALSPIRWTILRQTATGYSVGQSDAVGLAQRATANSLTIIPIETVLRAGDKVQVLPLDWCK